MSTEAEQDNKLDFGAGNVVALPSRCLRVAKDPTDCDICATLCPASAITAKEFPEEAEEASSAEGEEKPKPNARATIAKKQGVEVSEDCIHCSICTAVCPVEALSTTKYHLKGVSKQLKEMADKFEGVAMGCARALYGVPQRFASKAISLPCLASVGAEVWFLAAAHARDAILDLPSKSEDELKDVGILKVYLPPLICSDCPVNICGDAEETYVAAIAEAEAWGADNIELVTTQEELLNSYSGNLFYALSDATSSGKRELVEQLKADFTRSWKSAGDDLSRQKLKAEQLANKRKKSKKSVAPNLNAPRPFGKKSLRRGALRSALEQDETLAEDIELLVSGTDTLLCTGCGSCVSACPLNARRRISSNSTLYFGKIPEEQRPKGEQAAVTDKLCCMGCSACVQKCPTGACTLSWLSGKEFYNLRQS